MKLFEEISNPREIRRKLGLNQHDFWSKVGVTQSGGSRYESGRSMPRPVRELVRLVHIEQIDLTKIRKDDLIVAGLLKTENPDLYKSLKKATKSK
jgi:predicted transcriptional regulator